MVHEPLAPPHRRIVIFLRTGRVERVAPGADLAFRPGEAVVVRCQPATTFEDILAEIMRGFGLLDNGAPARLHAVAMIRTVRFFLATLPAIDMRAALVLDHVEHLPPGVIDRIRFLAPTNASGRPDDQPDAYTTTGPSGLTSTAAVPRRRATSVRLAALGLLFAAGALVLYAGAGRAMLTMPWARSAFAPSDEVIAERPLLPAPGFAVRVATVTTLEGASRVVGQLETRGVPAFVDAAEGTTRYGIVAGPYASREEAQSARRTVAASFPDAAVYALP